MIGTQALDQLLLTDPSDVGCGRVMELLHVYVELVANTDAAQLALHAGVDAHLAACGPCAEDFRGLLAAVGGEQ